MTEIVNNFGSFANVIGCLMGNKKICLYFQFRKYENSSIKNLFPKCNKVIIYNINLGIIEKVDFYTNKFLKILYRDLHLKLSSVIKIK